MEQKKLDTIVNPELGSPLEYEGSVMRRLSDAAKSVSGRIATTALAGIAGAMFYFVKPNKAEAQAVESAGYSDPLRNANGQIEDLQGFLDRCFKNNPGYEEIKKNLILLHTDGTDPTYSNVSVIDLDTIPCSEPISAMSLSDYSYPLSIVKAYEVMDAMDTGMMFHLPWTEGTFFDWYVAGEKGVIFSESAVVPPGVFLNGQGGMVGNFIVLPKIDDYTKTVLKTTLHGVVDNIIGLAHERRHADGDGHPHLCGYKDLVYDVNNLSAYGVSYWMAKSFVDRINFGINAFESSKSQEFLNWYLTAANNLRGAFCDIQPPILSLDSFSGGPAGGSLTGKLVDTFGDPIQKMLVEAYNKTGDFVAATVKSNPGGVLEVVRLFGHFDLDISSGDKCFNPVSFDVGTLVFNGDKDLGSLVLTPNVLSAPTIAATKCDKGKACNFTFSDAHDNDVVYRVDFGDGQVVDLALNQRSVSKIYSSTGPKLVTVDYACASHGVVSTPSQLEIEVGNGNGPDLTAQWIAEPYQTCTKPRKGLPKCTLKGGVLQISNAGNQKSGTASVAFYLSTDNKFDAGDLYLKRSSVVALKPTKTKNVSFAQSLAAGATAKDQYIITVINLPTDVDTTNNAILYGPIE